MFEDFTFDMLDGLDYSGLDMNVVGGPDMGMQQPVIEPVQPPPVVQNPIADQTFAQALVKVAERIGADPVDLATVISYETGGKFSPSIMGGAGGRHMGLIQFGPTERQQYGAHAGQTGIEQLEAVARYLQDRGFKPGMGILDLYSTINAGRPGRYNASDAANGGAPGTVADKVNNQMAGHRIKAAALLNGTLTPEAITQSVNRSAIAASPTGQRMAAANNPLVKTSLTEMARNGAFGPQAQQHEMEYARAAGLLNQVQPQVPAVQTPAAGAPTPVAELQAMLEDEGSPALPSAADLAGVPLASNYPVPFTAPTNEPTFLDKLKMVGRDSSRALTQGVGQVGQAAGQVVSAGKQFTAQALGTAASLPTAIAAGVTALPSLVGSDVGAETASELANMAGTTKKYYEDTWAGGEAANTPVEKFGAAAGRASAIPGSLPMTTGFTLADLASQGLGALIGPAEAAPKKFSREELTSMGLAPTQGQNAILPGPRKAVVTHNDDPVVIDTPAGKTTLPRSTLQMMGVGTLLTFGMMSAPATIRAVRNQFPQLPVFNPRNAERPVIGAPGTFALTNVKDFARGFDDTAAPIYSAARKAGVPLADIQTMKEKWRLQTGVATRSLSESAVVNGRVEMPSYRFNAPPLANVQMFEHANPEFTRYLQNHVMGDLTIAQMNRGTPGRPAPLLGDANFGPDVTPQAVLNGINAANRVHPTFRPEFTRYQANIAAARDFIGNGRWAIEPRGNVNLMNRYYGSTPILSRGMSKEVLKRIQQGESPTAILEQQIHQKFYERMRNESVGELVNAMARQDNGRFMTRRTAEWVRAHPGAAHTVVKHYEYGKPVYHTTDPLVASHLKADPYFFHGTLDGALFATKRLFETTTTSIGAPWFAYTNLVRAQQIATFTSTHGRTPMPWDTIAAIPRQGIPDISKTLADKMNVSSGGWIGQVVGQAALQGMGQRAQQVWDRSLQAQIAYHGGHRGTFTGQAGMTDIHTAFKQQGYGWSKAIASMIPSLPRGSWSRTFLESYSKYQSAMFDAVGFAYIAKNQGRGKSMSQLVVEARGLSGDPTISGQFMTGVGPNAHMMQYQPRNRLDAVAATAVKAYGAATEVGRIAVPWWNPTTQGMKRMATAYLDNPIRFTMALYGTQILPTALLYMYTRSLGKDPQGVSYIDHLMDGRSEYDTQMNMPIYVGGQSVSEASKVPLVHELSPAVQFTLHMLDQAYGRSHLTPNEAYQKVAMGMLGIMDPPMPPAGNMIMAGTGMGQVQGGVMQNLLGRTLGITLTGSPFGGEPFRRRPDPFDQLGGLEGTLELQLRALMPGTADIVSAFYTSFMNADEYTNGLSAGLKSAGKRSVEKTPIVRDILGYKPPVTAGSTLSTELYKKNNAIRNLTSYFREHVENEGAIRIKPTSNEGGTHVKPFLPQGLPPVPGEIERYARSDKRTGAVKGQPKPLEWANSPAVYQPDPTNPLFKKFGQAVLARFNKDKPGEGGFGYRTMWQQHSQYTKAARLLNKINDGNAESWRRELQKHPEWIEHMKQHKVDYNNPRAARNFMNTQRFLTQQMMLNSIRAVEQEFSKLREIQALTKGKPFKIEMIDPYGGVEPQGPQSEEGL